MLYDFDNCEWMESEDQTSQGVRKEIEDLKQRLRNISQQIIAKIGAEGPENAEDSVKRLLEEFKKVSGEGNYSCQTCGNRFDNDQEQCPICGSEVVND